MQAWYFLKQAPLYQAHSGMSEGAYGLLQMGNQQRFLVLPFLPGKADLWVEVEESLRKYKRQVRLVKSPGQEELLLTKQDGWRQFLQSLDHLEMLLVKVMVIVVVKVMVKMVVKVMVVLRAKVLVKVLVKVMVLTQSASTVSTRGFCSSVTASQERLPPVMITIIIIIIALIIAIIIAVINHIPRALG